MKTWSAIDISGGQPLHYRCQQVISPIMNESHKERQYQISWLMVHVARSGYEPQTVWIPLDALYHINWEEFELDQYIDWVLTPGMMGLSGPSRGKLMIRIGGHIMETLAQEVSCHALA